MKSLFTDMTDGREVQGHLPLAGAVMCCTSITPERRVSRAVPS